MSKIKLVVSDNDFTTFEIVIWGEYNIFWYRKLCFLAGKNMMKIFFKLKKLVRNYSVARNKNYVLILANYGLPYFLLVMIGPIAKHV